METITVYSPNGFSILDITKKKHKLLYPNLFFFFEQMKFLCQEKKMTNLSVLAREFEITTILSTPVSSLCASDKRWIQVATAFLGRNKVRSRQLPNNFLFKKK